MIKWHFVYCFVLSFTTYINAIIEDDVTELKPVNSKWNLAIQRCANCAYDNKNGKSNEKHRK